MKKLKKAFLLWGTISLTFGCSKQAPIQTEASLRAMSQSVFNAGTAVPGAPQVSATSTASGTTIASGSDGGFIAGPGGLSPSGGSSDGGSIGVSQPSNPSTGDSGNSTNSSGSTGSSINDMAPGAVVIATPQVATPSVPVIASVTPGTSDQGSTSSSVPVQPSASETGDSGQIAGPSNPSPSPSNPQGGDTGGVVNNNPSDPSSTPSNPQGGDGGGVANNTPSNPGSTPSNPQGGDSGGVVNPSNPGSTPSNPQGGDGGGVASNTPSTPGSQTGDTGSTPGGSCGCQKSFKFQLRRVCSIRRSNGKGLFFEEAKNPIFTVEAVNNSAGGDTSFLASMGFIGLPKGANVTTVNGVTAISVASTKLNQVDLLAGKYNSKFDLQLADFKKKMGASWLFSYLNVRVCEDSNNNGFCFDEPSVNQLSYDYPSFQATNFPHSIQLDIWSGRYKTVAKNPEVCETQYSPLVLDLRGNGLSLMGPEQGVSFDLNDTGSKIPTGWVGSSDDALLVRDLDSSGRIETGAELFGGATKQPDGSRAINGFEALRSLDSDGDGLITPKDAAWSELKLWIDRNKDGVSQRLEMMSLDLVGIESINLGYAQVLEVDPYGNQTRQRSTFVRKVGFKKYVLVVSDVWFNTIAVQ